LNFSPSHCTSFSKEITFQVLISSVFPFEDNDLIDVYKNKPVSFKKSGLWSLASPAAALVA
jgi:hypothetical protein